MTEARIQRFIVTLESSRDDAARQAGDLAELAGVIAGVRDAMAEVMLDPRGKGWLDKVMANLRLALGEAEGTATTLGLARAAACEALVKLVGPPSASSEAAEAASADTRPMNLDELAEISAKD